MLTFKEKFPSTNSQSFVFKFVIVPWTCKLEPTECFPDIASSTDTYIDCSVTERETTTPVTINKENAKRALDQDDQGALVLL